MLVIEHPGYIDIDVSQSELLLLYQKQITCGENIMLLLPSLPEFTWSLEIQCAS